MLAQHTLVGPAGALAGKLYSLKWGKGEYKPAQQEPHLGDREGQNPPTSVQYLASGYMWQHMHMHISLARKLTQTLQVWHGLIYKHILLVLVSSYNNL